MAEIYPSKVQREALLKCVEALGCRDAALRRDECGDWRISGKQGWICAVPGSLDRPKTTGFQIYVQRQSVREWSYTKKAFKPFAAVTNDGDEAGMLFLDRLPNVDEAEVIRQYVGIAKKRVMSEEERVRLASMGHRFEKRPDVEGDDQRARPASDVAEVERDPSPPHKSLRERLFLLAAIAGGAALAAHGSP